MLFLIDAYLTPDNTTASSSKVEPPDSPIIPMGYPDGGPVVEPTFVDTLANPPVVPFPHFFGDALPSSFDSLNFGCFSDLQNGVPHSGDTLHPPTTTGGGPGAFCFSPHQFAEQGHQPQLSQEPIDNLTFTELLVGDIRTVDAASFNLADFMRSLGDDPLSRSAEGNFK